MSKATETFWQGRFGNDYTLRNQVDWVKRIPFWRKVIELTRMQSLLEVGCNAGWNLRALHAADQELELSGCDVNKGALNIARQALPSADFKLCPAGDVWPSYQASVEGYDVVATAGLLIHIPPAEILGTMEQIALLADSFVVAVEYDWPSEEEISYRGHGARLWKRPFGQMYQDLGLKTIYTSLLGPEYGFGEGCTAWVMEKQ